jgi:hypothetical protein
MNAKTETYEEFIARGGKVEKLPNMSQPLSSSMRTAQKTVELKTLEEGEFLYGEKRAKKKAKKRFNVAHIDKSLLPKSLHYIFDSLSTLKDDE